MTGSDTTVQRKIIHVDFDAFFAAIEIRDNPVLSGRAIAVGGEANRRGVIATCSYEARRFGVRSAMASAHAKRLCPELVIIPPRFSVYKEASRQAHKIFNEYTELVEPLSLDEAYLDVTGSHHCKGSATLMAKEICRRIYQHVGITASAGVAQNKFLAKIASDWNKPNGIYVITPGQVDDFVFMLPVTRLFGVGKVTAKKLHAKGIETCGMLRQYSLIELAHWFGAFGERLWELSRGIDNRPVQGSRLRKSLSVERTYDSDISGLQAVCDQLPALLADLKQRYEGIEAQYRVTKHFVKVKFDNFTQTTLEESVGNSCDDAVEHFNDLLQRAWHRGERPVRLLGVGFSLQGLYTENLLRQLELFNN